MPDSNLTPKQGGLKTIGRLGMHGNLLYLHFETNRDIHGIESVYVYGWRQFFEW